MKFSIWRFAEAAHKMGLQRCDWRRAKFLCEACLEPVKDLTSTAAPSKIFSDRSLASTANSIYLGEFHTPERQQGTSG